MNSKQKKRSEQLGGLLEASPVTAGMYVRVHGDSLIMGRTEPADRKESGEDFDRVKVTYLNASSYGLSVKRHTGRWEKTPFVGTLEEMVEVIQTFMQHLVAP